MMYMPTSPDASFTQTLQDGGWIPEVITLRRKTISTWSQRLKQCFRTRPIHFHRCRHCRTSENSIGCKPEVETVSQTGSTNNSATKTDIDAISVAIGLFREKFFNDVHANLARCFLHSDTPRWRTDTGSSYNFATENDINVISAATT